MGCFAHGRLSADLRHPRQGDGYGILTFNAAQYFPLGRNGRVQMSMMQQYKIVEDDTERGPWKVSITGWIYNLATVGDDHQLVEYHWHPISSSHSIDPHVHMNSAKGHQPTGRVLIEDVLDYAVELGADCLKPERWATLGPENRQRFGLGATWGTRKVVEDGAPMPKLPNWRKDS